MDRTTPTGYLKVSVTSGGAAYPVEGAIVLVKDTDEEGGGEGGVIYSLRTDRSGQTVTVPLAAKDGSLSDAPGNETPYRVYGVEVIKDGYKRTQINEVQSFDGVFATLPVNLVPLGYGDAPYGRGPSGR